MFAFLGVCLFFNIPCMVVRVCVYFPISIENMLLEKFYLFPHVVFSFLLLQNQPHQITRLATITRLQVCNGEMTENV